MINRKAYLHINIENFRVSVPMPDDSTERAAIRKALLSVEVVDLRVGNRKIEESGKIRGDYFRN